MERNIRIFPTPEVTSEALAEFLVKELNEHLVQTGKFTIALSGGKTPKSLFEVLAAKYSKEVNWSSVQFFWVDERCVPPADPESNYGMTMGTFLGKINIPSACIHRIIGENEPENEALRYAAEIMKYVPLKNGFPSFDFILLGIGEDGHTASIFPGSERLFLSERICVAASHPVTGQTRVTITGMVINNAGTVAFFVTGTGKSPIIHEVLGAGNTGKDYPVSHVLPVTGNIFWFIDNEAGKKLK